MTNPSFSYMVNSMIIGIIEDDKFMNQALESFLQKEGFETLCLHTRKEALLRLTGKEDLLLIDIGLPDGDGLSLYQEVRKKAAVPAIFLTARDEEADMLAAFEGGAEDYVVKPFSMKVLLKRIQVVRNRKEGRKLLSCGELVLDLDRKEASCKGRKIPLTAKEYQLLAYFMSNQGQVLSKEKILDRIWGLDGEFVVDNTVSVTVNRLRKKIEPEGKPQYIKNVFGLGYRMGE